MASAGGSQCGYCTPGFVVSLFAEQYRPGRTGPCDPHALGGNLCRCTGYRPIHDAVLSLSLANASDPWVERLAQPVEPLDAATYVADNVRFDRPTSMADCLELLARDPQAKCVAGSTDVGVESNLKHQRWNHLISLEAIPELREFAETAEAVRLGAGLPLTDIGLVWQGAPESVGQWLPLFASPTIRNRATLGGNLATASPIGDSAPLLLSLEAVVEVVGKSGRRKVPLKEFFVGYRKTAMQPGELIAAVEVPKPFPKFTRFYKASKRRMDDISTVAAGLAMDWDDQGRVTRACFAFGGVAAVPWRAFAAEEEAIGEFWNEATVHKVQQALDRTLAPISDHRGSAEYRVEVAKSVIEKFWWESETVHAESGVRR